jgi:hypothetical protein
MANFQPFGTGGDGETPRRFAYLEASDLDELLEAAHSKRTKYSTALTKYSTACFNEIQHCFKPGSHLS